MSYKLRKAVELPPRMQIDDEGKRIELEPAKQPRLEYTDSCEGCPCEDTCKSILDCKENRKGAVNGK